MKNSMVKIISQMLFLLGLAFFFIQCENDLSGIDQQEIGNAVVTTRGQGTMAGQQGPGQGMSLAELCACLDNNYPTEALSEAETGHLLFMREEEKLARDVYLGLYEKWNLPVFDFISQSEQRHMDLVGCLISKYSLTDPVGDNAVGIFQNSRLQELYAALTAEGAASLTAALTVGAKIEDLDLFDLAQALESVDNEDVTAVFSELAKGSRNHLRAFTRSLSNWGVTYDPLYLSVETVATILAAPQETGGGICGACPYNNTPRTNPGTCDGTGPGTGPGAGPGAGTGQAQKQRGRN